MKHIVYSERLQKITLIILAILISVTAFLFFMYTDVGETTRQGLNLLKSIKEGRLSQFYIMCEECPLGNSGMGNSVVATYDIPLFIVFAIWDIPLFIYECNTGLSCLDSFWGIMWAKAIVIPFFILLVVIMLRVGRAIKGDKFSRTDMLLMILTSVYYFVPMILMGQYDVLSTVFIMLGIEGYIKKDNKKFLIGFAIANLFKMFSLFIFIPLLLLKEKRFLYLVRDAVVGCSLMLVTKLLQRIIFEPSEAAEIFVKDHLVSFFVEYKTALLYDGASIFVIGMILLCFYCYFKKTPDDKELGKWAIYVGCLGFTVFFMGSFTHPQWNLLLLPFITLLVLCEEEEYISGGLLITTFAEAGLLLAEIVFYDWIFDVKMSVYTLAGKLFYTGENALDYSLREAIDGKLSYFKVYNLEYIGAGIFVASMLFLLYWGKPDRDKKRFADIKLNVNAIMLCRLLILLGLSVALVMILY